MGDIIFEDQEARDRIENDLNINLMVQAGAGAGKTYALVGRMVEVIRTGRIKVENIAAITFTRKAAGEMRGRFFARLRETAQKEQNQEMSKRLHQALRDIDRCFIGTIHSFCGRLLRERPVEAGLSPDFSELEDREEEVIRSDFWHKFIQTCYAEDDDSIETFETLGLNAQDLYTFFKDRCQFNDLPLKPTDVALPNFTKAKQAAISLLEEAFHNRPEELLEGTDGFMETMEQAQHTLKNRNVEEPGTCAYFLSLFAKKPQITQRCWAPNQTFAKHLLKNLIPNLQEHYLIPIMAQWRQHIYTQAAEFIDRAVAAYDEHRHTTAQLTFQDLLLKSTALLRNNSDIRAFFKTRYSCLFIDEFQDTDPIQAEMLFYLTGSDVKEKDWRKLEPEPGRLFLVGDEKQAIYRFRRADVETFRLVCKRIKETGGDVLTLTTSFRTLGGPIDWINTSFDMLFSQGDPHYQSHFDPLSKSRPQGLDPYGIRKISVDYVYRNHRQTIAEAEAEDVANFIRASLDGVHPLNNKDIDGPLPESASPGDFLILTRTRKMLPVFARELEKAGIPYDLTGGGRLSETQEFTGLLDIFETIYRPEDPLPFIAYLRGMFVGLGDDDLYLFSQSDGHFNYAHDLPDDLSEALKTKLIPAIERLSRIHDWLLNKSPAAAFSLALSDIGLIPFAATQPGGSSRAGNLLRLLSLINAWESQGWHWAQVVEEMRAMADDSDYKVEEMTLESGRDDVVRLMNLHQAKGLEGRVVFLVDSGDSERKRVPSFHVNRTGKTPYLSLPIRIQRGFQSENLGEPQGWEEDAEEEGRFLSAEVLRLIYVAATRAENMLVISHYKRKSGSGPWDVLYPFLEGIPELEQPTAKTKKPHQEQAEKPDAARADRTKKWQEVTPPTRIYRAVTEDAQENADITFFTPRVSRGADYGHAIHELFEAAVQGHLPKDETAFVKHHLSQYGLNKYAYNAKQALDNLRASHLWQECQSSKEVHTEVPFASFQKKDTLPGVLRGVMDLIYRIDGGWKLVDFKTSGVEKSDLEALKNQYVDQITIYATQWENLTGEKVIEKGLWSTEHSQWIDI